MRKKFTKFGLAIAASVYLSGCAMTSPYWNQLVDDRADPVPVQTWTSSVANPVKIECAKAFHGGLWPDSISATWNTVSNMLPSSSADAYDTAGVRIYSVGEKIVLPNACWRVEETSAGPRWRTALRATQLNSSGNPVTFSVFDANGLECLGTEIGKARTWMGWNNKGCELTYSSGTKIPYVIFSAKS